MAKKVVQALSRTSKNLKIASKKLASVKSEKITEYKDDQIRNKFLSTDYKTVYLNNLHDAIMKNQEFGIAEYSVPLVNLINEPKLIQFDLQTKTVNLKNGMTKFGGTLDNWAAAVKKARKESSGASPLKASYYWQMMYKAAREKWEFKGEEKEKKFKALSTKQLKKYSEFTSDWRRRRYVDVSKAKNRTKRLAQLYWEIIRARIGYLKEGQAPWWYILNYGVAGAKMPNDRGGTAYPIARATRFVEKTELQLSKDLQTLLKKLETSDKEKEKANMKPVKVKAIGKSIAAAVTQGTVAWDEDFLEPEFGKSKIIYFGPKGKFVSKEYANLHPGDVIAKKVSVKNQYSRED